MKRYILINSLAGGGAEKVVEYLLKFLTLDKVFLLERDIIYNVNKSKVLYLSKLSVTHNVLIKNLFIPLYVFKLKKILKKRDKLISFLERANYVNIITSFFTGHEAIISVHMSQISGRPKLHPYNIINKLLYSKANLIITVSKGIKTELEKYFDVPPTKVRVIYNPVYIDEIHILKKEDLAEYKNIFEGSKVLITVGRLTKQKGQWYLLRIFKELKKKFPELKLIILGNGELKKYLVNLSENLGLKTYVWNRDKLLENFDVYFLGFQKNPFKFIAHSELFVFPSLWEGFGNALIEAMACGTPVISADCQSGPREILAPDTDFTYRTNKPEFAKYGILMPPFKGKFKKANEPLSTTEKLWIDVLSELFKNEQLRKTYSQKALERAKDFDINKIIQQWKEILQ
jgi:glycosyltransferase involved in cell wall biosynthesis